MVLFDAFSLIYSSININIQWCSGIFAGFEHVSIFGYYDCFMVITDEVNSDIRQLIFFFLVVVSEGPFRKRTINV